MTAPKSQAVDEPTDPDVGLRVPARRQQSWRAQGPIVAVVAPGRGPLRGRATVADPGG